MALRLLGRGNKIGRRATCSVHGVVDKQDYNDGTQNDPRRRLAAPTIFRGRAPALQLIHINVCALHRS